MHAPEIVANPVSLMARLFHFSDGFRDFRFVPERNMLMSISSDIKTPGNLEKSFAVVTKEFDNATPIEEKVPRGSLEVWEIFSDGEGKKMKRIWTYSYKHITYCMDWNPDVSTVALGYKDGTTALLKITPDDIHQY